MFQTKTGKDPHQLYLDYFVPFSLSKSAKTPVQKKAVETLFSVVRFCE